MVINLKEAIAILENYNWCSLRFITADLQKGNGGFVIEVPKCRICRNQPIVDQVEKIVKEAIQKHVSTTGRSPNHHYHFTRNIEFPNKKIRKVHPILITHINNIALV